MKLLITTIFFFGLLSSVDAQFPDNNWIFGYASQMIENDSFGLSVVSFENNQITIGEEMDIVYDMSKNNSSISDEQGNLLFYFNGHQVFNHQHQLMENGDDMYLGTLDLGGTIAQGSLILPIPESDNQYIIVNTHVDYDEELMRVPGEKLFYSIIDMNANSGLGEVVLKNQLLFDDAPMSYGQLTAVRHANGRDWWIVWPLWDSNRFLRYRIHPGGINRDNDILVFNPIVAGVGQMHYTIDGSKLIIHNGTYVAQPTSIYIYDFDHCEGRLSNEIVIANPNEGSAIGSAVSSNNRFLYAITSLSIYQYDLWSEDIAESQILVAEYDGFLDPWLPTTFYLGQLARDGKIYISSPNTVKRLTVIEHPDRYGDACEINQHSIRLPVRNSFSIPNIPNHRLGPIDGSECDTLDIDNIPLARFRSDQDTSNYLSFYFQDLSDYEPETWFWTFGDGTTSQDTSPVHTYAADGIYEVCLTASNGNGCHSWCDTLNLGIVSTNEGQDSGGRHFGRPVLFPNPFQHQFSVVLNDYYPQNAQLLVYDELGRRIHQQRIFHGWNTVDGNDWAKGLYFWELWESDSVKSGDFTQRIKFATGKLIKR